MRYWMWENKESNKYTKAIRQIMARLGGRHGKVAT